MSLTSLEEFLLRDLTWFQRKRKGVGKRIQTRKLGFFVFWVFLYFFPKCVKKQIQADVQLVPTDVAGRTESALIGQF